MQAFDEIVLLGTKFHKVKVYELIDYIVLAAKQQKKTTISHINVRGMNFAYELSWYKEFLNKSDLVFCDGFGVLLAAQLCGCHVNSSHRMTCPDYIENLAISCSRENVSLFLLAGQPGTVEKAIAKLHTVAPNLKVAGHHGYFHKSGLENDKVIEQINQFKPDVLYVGFGMPLQEQWIKNNSDRIDAKVFLPLGACLDFYTGTVKRGPTWMTSYGMEWVTRLFVEPKRLWKRYVVGNPLFFYRIFKDTLAKMWKKGSQTSIIDS